MLAVNDYRPVIEPSSGNPGTVYIDAINVDVRASFEPLPEASGNWPLDVRQVRFTLDGGRERADVQVWTDATTAAELRAELDRVLRDPRCGS